MSWLAKHWKNKYYDRKKDSFWELELKNLIQDLCSNSQNNSNSNSKEKRRCSSIIEEFIRQLNSINSIISIESIQFLIQFFNLPPPL